MSDIRLMPTKRVKSHRIRLCDRCGYVIEQGEVHELHKGFDPNRTKIGSVAWGAWVSERDEAREAVKRLAGYMVLVQDFHIYGPGQVAREALADPVVRRIVEE